ncbi:MAG: NAD(P)/FAD-dependent oxidoreductase [Terriglobia bacterium]|nr:NAD(P)/FAD-dependent oxidoreductase [Terriglobia bacterium]
MSPKKAIIIGAGPAGLTAAYELLTRSDITPIVLEKSTFMGGISRTVNYKGNRIDIGGHRFFSKSDRVMQWWLKQMPMDETAKAGTVITYQNQVRELPSTGAGHNAAVRDDVMLLRNRKSRIYFLRKFFEYPIQLSAATLQNLGIVRTIKIGFSYMKAMLFPPKRIENLEQFFISRFGKELYETFFHSYTEKVWGVPCQEISAEWGAQRIKGLSITTTIAHMLKKMFQKRSDVRQKNVETSLIQRFLYPKLGPGQLWEIVAQRVQDLGGTILTEFDVDTIECENGRVVSISGRDKNGSRLDIAGDYFFSTMPIQELTNALRGVEVPAQIREISDGLQYRDFVTVGLLVKRLSVEDKDRPNQLIRDNWIYIQEPDVRAGRLQIFNNWSPYMVKDPDTVWIGVEYFCYQTDDLWTMPEGDMANLAKQELEKIGILKSSEVLDATVIRMPKTYPAYFGTYTRFDELRGYLDGFDNLFLVGRNGMHKYNNQDHSMLTAMTAVDNILAGVTDKSNLWAVNTEMEYHEEKEQPASRNPDGQKEAVAEA